jgi:hypothetical protein
VGVAGFYGLRHIELDIPTADSKSGGGSRVYLAGAPGGVLGWVVVTFLWQLAARLLGNSIPAINSFIGVLVFLVPGLALGFFAAAILIDPLAWVAALKNAKVIDEGQTQQCAKRLDRQFTRVTLHWNVALGVLWLVWIIVVAPRLPPSWLVATPLPALLVLGVIATAVRRVMLGSSRSEGHPSTAAAIAAAARHAAESPSAIGVATPSNVLEMLIPGSTSFLPISRYKAVLYD